MSAMLAAVLDEPRRLRVVEVAVPIPAECEVLVRVHTCGICGSDRHTFRTGPHLWLPSRIGGHEFGGEVAQVGPGVTGFAPGDKVVVRLGQSCGKCPACRTGRLQLCALSRTNTLPRGGGFAEYAAVAVEQVVRLPEQFWMEHVALVEPLAVAIHAAAKIDLADDESVLIVGSGPIALLLARYLRARDVQRQITLVCRRDSIARLAAGVCEIIDLRGHDFAGRIRGLQVGYAVECAGTVSAFELAHQMLAPGGRLIVMGLFGEPISLDLANLMFSEHRVEGSFLYRPDEFAAAIAALHGGITPVGELPSLQVPLRRIQEGFELLEQQGDDYLKVAVYPERT